MAKATPALEITQTEAPPPKPRKRGGKPVAIEEHTVVTKWAEEKKVGALPPKARKAPVAEEFEEDEEPEETEMPDSAHALFEEYGFDEGLMMDINRLPDYTLNRRTDPVSWQWVTMMPFTPLFKQEIALRHARPHEANWFLIVLKDANGRIIRREDGKGRIGPFSVEAASNEERQANGLPPHPQPANVVATINQATPPYPYPPQPVVPVVDEDQVIDRFFNRMKHWNEMTRRSEQRQENNTPAAPVEGRLAVAQMLLEDPAAVKQITQSIIGSYDGGNGSSEPWYGRIIESVAVGLTPGLNAILQVSAQKIGQAQMTVQQQQNGAPASLPESSPQPEAPPQTQEPIPAQQAQPEPEEIIFGLIMSDCVKRKIVKPEVCAKNVLAFVDRYIQDDSGWTPFNAAVDIFLSNDVADIVSFASTQNPIAARLAKEEDVLPWLKAVQDEIRKEWANDGTEETHS